MTMTKRRAFELAKTFAWETGRQWEILSTIEKASLQMEMERLSIAFNIFLQDASDTDFDRMLVTIPKERRDRIRVLWDALESEGQ